MSIKENFYMDDILTGSFELELAKNYKRVNRFLSDKWNEAMQKVQQPSPVTENNKK